MNYSPPPLPWHYHFAKSITTVLCLARITFKLPELMYCIPSIPVYVILVSTSNDFLLFPLLDIPAGLWLMRVLYSTLSLISWPLIVSVPYNLDAKFFHIIWTDLSSNFRMFMLLFFVLSVVSSLPPYNSPVETGTS